MREKIAYESMNPNEGRVEELKKLFPEAFSEGKLDVEKLVTLVGQSKVAGPERFNFTWNGKREALELLQTPSRATLLPCPEESVNFDTTKNLFIEGDNLEVLKLLLKPYFGKVKLIYIDPPYNTGQDFVYPDNYADPLATYLQLTGQSDAEGKLLTSNPETNGRYHSAWLSMMYPRLFLAKQLLREDGFICVSIDDHECHHLRMLMDEIFGSENFIATAVWQKAYTSNMTAKHISDTHDYILIYCRNEELGNVGRLKRTAEQIDKFQNPDNDPRGPWKAENLSAGKFYAAGQFEITTPSGRKVLPPNGRYWRCNQQQYEKWLNDGRITFGKDGGGRPMLKKYLAEVGDGLTPNTWWTHQECGSNKEASIELKAIFDSDLLFDTPKPQKLIDRLLQLFGDKSGIVLDFFSGSSVVAQSVIKANGEDGGIRRFVMVQLPEPAKSKKYPTIAEIGKERIRRVIVNLKNASLKTPILNDGNNNEDLGFKVFKLTKPSIVPPTDTDDKETYFKLLAQHNEPLVKDWKVEDVLWEVALREGFGLLSTFHQKTLSNGNTVHELTDPEKDPPGRCVICLDAKVKADISQAYELTKETLFICRDAALDDSAAANLALQCRLKTI